MQKAVNLNPDTGNGQGWKSNNFDKQTVLIEGSLHVHFVKQA